MQYEVAASVQILPWGFKFWSLICDIQYEVATSVSILPFLVVLLGDRGADLGPLLGVSLGSCVDTSVFEGPFGGPGCSFGISFGCQCEVLRWKVAGSGQNLQNRTPLQCQAHVAQKVSSGCGRCAS